MKQPIHNTYDRLGRMTSAIVAGISTNAYTYDQETLALIMETQNGMEITRTTDALGRDTGFSFGQDYAVQYGFDAYGRFSSVTSTVSSASLAVQYTHLANSELLSGRSVEIGNSLLAVGYSYEAARSLITSVENSFDSAIISRYDYTNDELGRRTHIERSGLAFGDLAVQDAYGYNARSEVTSARRTPLGSQTELRGFSYDYAYDPIGNRVASTEYDHEGNALESGYTANALNQYGQRTVPGYAGVRGEADTNATVKVNANPTWRWGEYFYGGDDADNSANAIMKQLEITATYSNLYSAVTGRVFVAQTPEAFTYDDDGNLTQDGRFGYTWNGENRLIKAETRDDLPASVPCVKVDYRYDHQFRRVAVATSTWTNDAWQAVESRAFIYDGWNVVIETIQNQQSTITNQYVWGLDLSGTIHGAGGIGGLLTALLDGTTALYCHDANGNVGQLIASEGQILAHYEYSPFGETVVATGPQAKANPYRFSTKWFDDSTALGDWGYRWYSPRVGRWLSRDPIGDIGFLSLYLESKDPQSLALLIQIAPEARHLVTSSSHYRLRLLKAGFRFVEVSTQTHPAYVFVLNDPISGFDAHGDVGHIAGGALIGCAAGASFSLVTSWLGGDNRCQCVCKAFGACGVGAVAGALSAANPAWSGCLAGLAGSVINTAVAGGCNSLCGQAGEQKPICVVLNIVLATLGGCGAGAAGGLPAGGLQAYFLELTANIVGYDIAAYCNLLAQ